MDFGSVAMKIGSDFSGKIYLKRFGGACSF